jgi:hypothetical protein
MAYLDFLTGLEVINQPSDLNPAQTPGIFDPDGCDSADQAVASMLEEWDPDGDPAKLKGKDLAKLERKWRMHANKSCGCACPQTPACLANTHATPARSYPTSTPLTSHTPPLSQLTPQHPRRCSPQLPRQPARAGRPRRQRPGVAPGVDTTRRRAPGGQGQGPTWAAGGVATAAGATAHPHRDEESPPAAA